MSDSNNTTGNSNVPNVIKGTGYFTPMDIAPTAVPSASAQPTTVEGSAGMPSAMHNPPGPTASADTSPPATDSSNGATE